WIRRGIRSARTPSCDPRGSLLGAARNAREIFASFSVVLHFGRQAIQRGTEPVERVAETRARDDGILGELAGDVAGGKAQLPNRRKKIRRGVRQPRHVSCGGSRRNLSVPRKFGELAGSRLLAEKECRCVGKLMGLVENDGVAGRQQF